MNVVIKDIVFIYIYIYLIWIIVNWVVLDYIFCNLYTYITVCQHNGDVSPENSDLTSSIFLENNLLQNKEMVATPWSRDFPEKPTVSHLVKQSRLLLYERNTLYCVPKSPPADTAFSHGNPFHALRFWIRSVLMFFFHLRLDVPSNFPCVFTN
jgi:hypothetical protein